MEDTPTPRGQEFSEWKALHGVHERAPEPKGFAHVRYRGWEVGYSPEAACWSGDGWIAYKGGCDLGAPEVRARSYAACLDEIDDKEDA